MIQLLLSEKLERVSLEVLNQGKGRTVIEFPDSQVGNGSTVLEKQSIQARTSR
jgi:hypothetical protein